MATGGFKIPGATGYGPLHFASVTVNWNDAADLTAGTRARWIAPAGAHIVAEIVTVQTAFNAGTTNVLTVGTVSGTATDMMAAGDLDETTAATTILAGSVFHAGGLIILNSTSDTPVYVKYAQTGTVASAGKATITWVYALPRSAAANA